jgi:hypothetical protein
MIRELAELLGMDEQALVDAIRAVAGDKPQMTMQRQMFEVPNDHIRDWRATGFGVIIATGMETDFEMMHETEQTRIGVSRISTVTLRLRP